MVDGWSGPLQKIDDYRWRIPRSYKKCMRVDGLIIADDELIKSIRQDQAPEQVANVACLPGIIKYSLAMPDIHWGYGACLTKDAKVLTALGFNKPIEDFKRDWFSQNLKSVDFSSQKVIETSIEKFMKLKPKRVFKINTKAGYELKATEDHPLLTAFGMKPLREIKHGENIAILPFQGVPYEEPSSETIIYEEDIKKALVKLGREPGTPKFEINLRKLKERNLFPLNYKHPKLPYILKIMGFIFGDASMNFIGKKGEGVLNFAGKPEDLEEVRKDLKRIGYTPGPIHHRRTKSSRNKKKFYDCYQFSVNASSLVVLLEALGVPRGRKVNQAYRVPKWIFKAPLWQKRLFLASLFGCELRKPHRRKGRRGYFNAPVFPMAKREELIENGKDFLKDISGLLKEFGVETLYIDKRKRHVSKKKEISWALELVLSPKPQSLFNLWSQIGFEYNSERAFLANLAVQYLKLRERTLREKEQAIKEKIPQLLKSGLSYQKIAFQLAGNPLTKRFIIDVCYKLNKNRKIVPRIPYNFPSFDDYLKEATEGLGQSGMVWDEIISIEEIPYHDFVYDFTVSHSDHNFIANNFVVSNCIGGVAAFDLDEGIVSPGICGYDINCGVRLIHTNLFYGEIKDRIEDIINQLFNDVPSGLGSKGQIKAGHSELRKILIKGAAWAVERGYGDKDDLEHTEEAGAIKGADPEAVTERSYERGRAQVGTLGSGNHFLEIQAVDEVYDEEIARIFGLEKNQITIMIHTGSRGFGYQVCDDALKEMRKAVDRYNIDLADRQLACAPVNSPEGRRYLAAMRCAANYAWCNRQYLMHLVRKSFEKVFGRSYNALGMNLIYDVAHNIVKIEEIEVEGEIKKLCVHRKGATRAFPPGHKDIPDKYKPIGQPVLIPGDMGTHSYLLVGTEKAKETFYSTCHGAGRVMSRKKAKQQTRIEALKEQLQAKDILARAHSIATLVEEAPAAYKDIDRVVNVVAKAGLSKKVCRMRPIGVIKG